MTQTYVRKLAKVELVGIDEPVAQNQYSASVAVNLPAYPNRAMGEILSVMLIATEDNAGAIQDSAGKLLILSEDPATSAGDAALTAAEWETVIGVVDIAAADWVTDAAGGVVYSEVAIAFENLATLYLVWLHQDATGLNDGATDDEVLEAILWVRTE